VHPAAAAEAVAVSGAAVLQAVVLEEVAAVAGKMVFDVEIPLLI